MENNLKRMIEKAVEIRNQYSKTDPEQWGGGSSIYGHGKRCW